MPRPKSRTKPRAATGAKKAQAQAKADRAFAAAYCVFHAARLRLWEALAELEAGGNYVCEFATEAEGATSARCENTAFWGGFRFQPERPAASDRTAGVRNIDDYPAELRERTGGWCTVLSPAARALAERAHGYLEYVRLRPSGGGVAIPLLRADRLWTGIAPRIDIVPTPPLSATNNADVTGRLYARMDAWRAQVAQVDPRRLPVPRAGGGLVTLDLVDGTVRVGDGPPTTEPLHPLRCYLAARTVFWAQVSRLETVYADRYAGRGLSVLAKRTMRDKHVAPAEPPVEDVVTREDLIQELTPYTYRAMESWHPARGCYSTYFEFKVRHALRNLRAQSLPRSDSFAQEQDYMSGAADPYTQRGSSWRRERQHTDAPPGVSEALIAALTTQPDGPGMVALREQLCDARTRPAKRRALAECLDHMLADQAPGFASLQPRAGVVIRRTPQPAGEA